MEEKNEVRIPIGVPDLQSHNLFICKPPNRLFHYTNLTGANGIITSQSLRLTYFQYLNDQSELHLGIRLFREAASRATQNISNTDKKEFLENAAKQLDSFGKSNICIASFCEEGDLLSQWRAYGTSGNSIALAFSGDMLLRAGNSRRMYLFKCVYSHSSQARIAEDLVKILLNSYDVIYNFHEETESLENEWEGAKRKLISYFNTTFLQVAPVIKNNYFKEEKEWRIVSKPISVTDSNFQATISNERVSQYYSLNFSTLSTNTTDILERVVIGPTQSPEHIGGAFMVLLQKNGFDRTGIDYSLIPYRH